MKSFVLIAFILNASITCFSQAAFTSYKGGHEFDITVPSYMSRTIGLNSSAILQFKNTAKGVYALVLEDNKEELHLVDLNFTSLEEFQEYTIKKFLKDAEQRSIGEPVIKTLNGFKYIHVDASYYDKELKQSVYYFYGIVETKSSYYKFLGYSSLENKEKFKADLQKSFFSIHD